jgi:hypothetical protein
MESAGHGLTEANCSVKPGLGDLFDDLCDFETKPVAKDEGKER